MVQCIFLPVKPIFRELRCLRIEVSKDCGVEADLSKRWRNLNEFIECLGKRVECKRPSQGMTRKQDRRHLIHSGIFFDDALKKIFGMKPRLCMFGVSIEVRSHQRSNGVQCIDANRLVRIAIRIRRCDVFPTPDIPMRITQCILRGLTTQRRCVHLKSGQLTLLARHFGQDLIFGTRQIRTLFGTSTGSRNFVRQAIKIRSNLVDARQLVGRQDVQHAHRIRAIRASKGKDPESKWVREKNCKRVGRVRGSLLKFPKVWHLE